uniref:Uncharacterized protein n=1 Tax=Tanacetum cinerariifolium TaxID=118510 RepID=A0A699KH00_TANCI|nr:hypothetical protein [Tanacetum cinerariifolium]
MAKSSSDNEVFDSLNSKITDLSEKLIDSKNMLYHYKLELSQVEARLVEFKNQEIKFCEKIRGLEFKVESKTDRIENLTKELEMLKKEKEGLDSKLTVDSPTMIKTNKDKTVRKPSVKYAKISPTRTTRPNMNVAQPKRTSFYKPAHLYVKRSFQKRSAVRTQFRVPKVSTVSKNFPTVTQKFPTGNSKLSTADLGNKGKAVKASARWIWRPKQNSTVKGPNSNSVPVIFKKETPKTTLMTKVIETVVALGT